MTTPEALPTTLIVKNGGIDHSVFMSYGLLSRLIGALGDIDNLPNLAMNAPLQERVLVEIFTKRDDKGVPTHVPSLDEIRVSLEEVSSILDFVGDHIANFFMGAVEKAQRRVETLNARVLESQAKVQSLMPIKPGSLPSVLKKAAA